MTVNTPRERSTRTEEKLRRKDLAFLERIRAASLDEMRAIRADHKKAPEWKRVAIDRRISKLTISIVAMPPAAPAVARRNGCETPLKSRPTSSCPGETCPMCTGALCRTCGAGTGGNHAPCKHDVLERHDLRPPATPVPESGQTPKGGFSR